MAASTILLSQIFGPMLLVVGVSILMNTDQYRKMIKELHHFSLTYYLAAVMAMGMGLIIVLMHNRWDSLPQVLVSIIGWGALIKGVLRLLVPEVSRHMIHRFTHGPVLTYWAVLIVVWGGALSYFGYVV